MAKSVAAGASDFVMPDAEKIGGVTGWLRAAALAESHGLPVSSHLLPEISAHLLAVSPTCHWLEYVDFADPILEEPLRIQDGNAVPFGAPGIGFKFNQDAIRRYTVS
jgi:mandelate racemase